MQNEHKLIDGKAISLRLQEELATKISMMRKNPVLAVVVVGDNPASAVYVCNKQKAAQKVGIECRVMKFSDETTQEELENLINELNSDVNVNGIIIQQPIPKHLDVARLLNLLNPSKDVDGFSPLNLGWLMTGSAQGIYAATPKGIMYLLQETGVSLKGKLAVVIGRSNIVGKPMAQMLLNADCTVVMAHSKTENLSDIVLRADIIVVACGVPNLVKADWVKEGAIVIDVGINSVDGKLCGDVDFENVKNKASYITPVPGGVGPMTVAMLLQNTYDAALLQSQK